MSGSWRAHDAGSGPAGPAAARTAPPPLSKPDSPFHHYAATFDAVAVIRRYAKHDLTPDPRYLINFIGVKMETRYLPSVLEGWSGKVDHEPVPANWHADMAEWAAALRAVDLARDTFVVAELGCGWGCWLNNTGIAARQRGLETTLIGVEGDEGHIAFARDCCALNGFASDRVDLHRGIAAAQSGTALFPRQATAGQDWALQPVFGADEAQRREAATSGRFDELPMVGLADVVGTHARLDLLHLDIQGGEADLVEQSAGLLAERVAYMVIGTHSRAIEGRLVTALLDAGWRLEVERPMISSLTPGGPISHVDGVQGWRNMRLLPDAA